MPNIKNSVNILNLLNSFIINVFDNIDNIVMSPVFEIRSENVFTFDHFYENVLVKDEDVLKAGFAKVRKITGLCSFWNCIFYKFNFLIFLFPTGIHYRSKTRWIGRNWSEIVEIKIRKSNAKCIVSCRKLSEWHLSIQSKIMQSEIILPVQITSYERDKGFAIKTNWRYPWFH